jgi:hypothetical protein
MCAASFGPRLCIYPTTGIAACCVRAARGHAAASPSSVMKSHCVIGALLRLRAGHYHTVAQERRCASQQKLRADVADWVKSRKAQHEHYVRLSLRKRTQVQTYGPVAGLAMRPPVEAGSMPLARKAAMGCFSRIYSKYLALQIKACELKLLE